MRAAFGDVVWLVCGIGVVGALIGLLGSGKLWEEYGKRGLVMEREQDSGNGWAGGRGPSGAAATTATSAAALAERDEEIRQMLEARNARRARRGEPPIDIDDELRRLTAPAAPAIDDGLRAEIRDMVLARNHRRARRGEPPLDVESEVEREIAQLGEL